MSDAIVSGFSVFDIKDFSKKIFIDDLRNSVQKFEESDDENYIVIIALDELSFSNIDGRLVYDKNVELILNLIKNEFKDIAKQSKSNDYETYKNKHFIWMYFEKY